MSGMIWERDREGGGGGWREEWLEGGQSCKIKSVYSASGRCPYVLIFTFPFSFLLTLETVVASSPQGLFQ